VLRRCLQKDTKRRLHDIADARLEIEEVAAEPDHAESELEQALSRTSVYQRMRAVWWMLPTAVGIGVVAAWMVWKFLAVPAGDPRTVTRLSLSMPPGVSMDADPLRPGVALSPDGRWLVFVATEEGTRKLFKRSLDKFDVTPIPGTENARFAFFSPDGRWVGFWDDAEDRIKKVALGGGVPVVLCEAPNAWGASWGINGKIVFSPGNLTGLWQVAEAGGEPEPILAPSPETGDASYLLPEFLPDGKAVLYTAWRGGFTAASAKIGVLDLASGETKVLLDNAASARYLSTGHLVFGRGGRAEIAPFDLETREVTGPSVPIPEPIFYHPGGKLHLAVSNTGTLAFVPGGGAPQRRLIYVDLQGNKVLASGSQRGYEYPRFSPDAQRLAVTISEFGEPAIWIVDRTAGLETRLAGKGRRQFPLWSPDGSKVVFALETEDPPASWSLFWQQVDASDPPEPLLMARKPGEWLWPYSWTPDGKTLVLGKWSAGISQDVYYVSLDNPEELHPLLTTEAEERGALLSPDGRWIAYVSNETGRFAIYVQRFPEGGERHQISTGASQDLVGWAPAGKKLYYVLEGRLMEVGITTTPRFQVDPPRVLFEVTYERGDWYYPDLHLSADGEKFIMVVPDDKWGRATEVKVILNWFEELEKLAPTHR
jgi:serine/threonine-protein kinase